MTPPKASEWPQDHEELVTLLRMAADTSGKPLSDGERQFLIGLMEDCSIDATQEGIHV